MKNFALVATLMSLVAIASLHGQSTGKRLITHEDVFTMKRTSGPKASPDGKWIVYTVNEPHYDSAVAVSDLWIVATDGSSSPRRLTGTRRAESGAAWSPDSQRIAFSTRRDGDETDQIYVLPISGGEAQRVTALPSGATNPQWRPDGAALLVESFVKTGAAPDKSTARAYDSMPVRFWNTWLDGAKPRLYVQPLSGGPATDVLGTTQLGQSADFEAPFSGEGADRSLQAQWSGDGAEIVFVAYLNTRSWMTEDPESHLFRVRPGSEPVRMSKSGDSVDTPRFTPDGKVLLVRQVRTSTAGDIYSLVRLARFDWPTGAQQLLTDGLDRSVGEFTICSDGRVVFSAEDHGFSQLFQARLSGTSVTKIFEVGEGGYGSPVCAGTQLFSTHGASTRPVELVRVDERRGTHTLITDSNRALLAQLDLPKPEHFWFTAKNGKRIHSVIWFPPQLDRTKKYPLIVNPHGGPNAMSADSFSIRWNYHLLTAPGYVLLATNYTGSTGFGEKFAEDIETDLLRGPANEILEAVDEAIRRYPFIDASRQAAVGASYGGYLMNWFNGHTNQFRALVVHAGAANNESQYGVNDGGWGRELRMGVPIWETGKGQWMDQSPFRYANKWKTPSLITQGEIDYRVPVNESLTTFKLLQRNKVPARLLVFPDEGHWILKGENGRRHMQEVLAWLAKYLQTPVTATAAN